MVSLNTVPNEIILSILEHLTYDDLKYTVPIVCKRFHTILQKSSDTSATPIDAMLFRDSPRKPPLTGTQSCILNPCVDDIRYSYTQNISDVLVWDHPNRRFWPFLSSPVRHENLCTPAVTRARIVAERWGYNEPPINVAGTGIGGAVTMLDLMEAVVAAVNNVWNMDDIWNGGYSWDGLEQTKIVDGVLHGVDGWNV